jgi:hypothetical protein
MARRKNSSFVGAPLGDVVRDASIYARVIDNAAGDFALVYDKITGENGEANTINHSGATDRGCPLRLPAGSQTIARELALYGAATEAEFYILVIPVLFPKTGISESWTLELDVDLRVANQQIECDVMSSTWALTSGAYVGQRVVSNVAGADRYRRVVFDLVIDQTAAATWRYIAVRAPLYLTDLDPGARIEGWRLFPTWRTTSGANGLTNVGAAASGNPFPTNTMTPSVMAGDSIDAAMTAADAPLDPWVLTRINRSINTLWEYLTGLPAPGNNSITVSQTRDHNRTSFTAEPLIEFPLCSVALGCMRVSSVTTKTDFLGTLSAASPIRGPIDWVRYPQTTAANEVASISSASVRFPSFKDTGTTDLDIVILALDYSTAGAGTWQARLTTGSGVSAWTAFTQLGTTNLWSCMISGNTFSGGVENLASIAVRNTTGGSIGGRELLVLGYGYGFTP